MDGTRARKRIRLTTLRSVEGLPTTGLVDAAGYSRFKHGDAVGGRRYAMALAALAARRIDGIQVRVTTSAYDRVPPAAHSLLAPFVQHLRVLRPEVDVATVRMIRRGVSDGDYARMPLAARRDAVDARNLHLADDVRDSQVLALDDIRVTGTHELAVDACLRAAGVRDVRHLYVVDAHRFAATPSIESTLNEAAIRDAADLIAVTRSARFVPNARFCRRVLTLPADQQALFAELADASLLAWLAAAVEHDGLAGLAAYAEHVARWRRVSAAQVALPGAGVG